MRASRRDLIAHPLARLANPIGQRVVGLLGLSLDAVLGGLRGVLRILKLLVQLAGLVAREHLIF